MLSSSVSQSETSHPCRTNPLSFSFLPLHCGVSITFQVEFRMVEFLNHLAVSRAADLLSPSSPANLSPPIPSLTPSTPHLQTHRIAVFSHCTAIKCLLRGILGSSPHMTHKIDIDPCSLSILKYSPSGGWRVGKVNDTSHLLLQSGPFSQ